MSSLLFQSTGKGDGSSSSTSAANPFMNLAHFYEQELTDQHIDSSSSSRQYRQQSQHSFGKQPVTNQHLFPSFPFSSASTSDTHNDVSYTQAHDEFKDFSRSGPHHHHHHSHNLIPFQQHFDSHNGASVDGNIEEYLKNRQEYYLREAMARSQDREDGLGPIVDFSQHISALVESGQYSPVVKSRLEDHLEARHHNPYAEKHRFSQGMRASSQREQVLMDMSQSEINKLENDLDLTWKESILASGSSSTRPTDLSTTMTYSQEANIPKNSGIASRTIETEALYGGYGLQQHYTNLDSQMQEPINNQAMAMNRDWADEFARATLASSQSQSDQISSHPTGRRDSLKTCGFMLDPRNNHDLSFSDPATLLSFTTSTASVSSPSTSAVTSAPTFDTHQHYGDNLIKQQHQYPQIPVPVHSVPEPFRVVNEVYNDDVFEGDMLQAWMETLAQEKQEADERAKENHRISIPEPVETYNDDGFENDMLQAWKESLEQEKQESDERTEESIERIIPTESVEMAAMVNREMYNDDVFEGNMLQAWIETLALEKQEAKENEEKLRQAKDDEDREKEKEEEESKSDNRLLDETEQKLILEMALRRLNGLMHQLGQKQGLLEGARAGMWRRDDNKIAE
ncbi:hypothetical protein BGX26_010008 [Mortierella sp. AD094]|nr:hypothetical protein BGX26_010008 [Mortierella sp. AD094]